MGQLLQCAPLWFPLHTAHSVFFTCFFSGGVVSFLKLSLS